MQKTCLIVAEFGGEPKKHTTRSNLPNAGVGYAEVRLRSSLHRTEAHKFYQSIG